MDGFGPDGFGTNGTYLIEVGRNGATSGRWYGILDEIAIWNRTLTELEITNLFNAGTGKSWPLD
jgi:hypothetical protein